MSIKSLWLCAALAACGGSSKESADAQQADAANPDAAEAASGTVGTSGGTVGTSGGVQITVPAGAVTAETTITVTVTNEMVTGAVTPVYKFEPEGTVFQQPISVTIPVTNPTASMSVYWSKLGAVGYDELTGTIGTDSITAQTTHFSTAYVAPMTPIVFTGAHYGYVIDSLLFPTSNSEAQSYGLDLDGDQTVDNNLGMIYATRVGQTGLSDNMSAAAAIAGGTLILLADIQTSDFANTLGAGFKTMIGEAAGSATYTIAPTSPDNAQLPGTFVNSQMTAGPGQLVVPIASNNGSIVFASLLGARVTVSASASAITSAVIGGAVSMADVDNVLLPAHWASDVAVMEADCNGCVCPSGSTGGTMLALFDVNQDCTVTLTEYKSNGLVMSLYAPDVVINGVSAVSIGVKVTAVQATIN